MVEEVLSWAVVILERLDNRITTEEKKKAWEEVAARVNAVSRVGSSEEV